MKRWCYKTFPPPAAIEQLRQQIGLQLGNLVIIRDLNRGFRHVWLRQ
jgi:hypothetical protein